MATHIVPFTFETSELRVLDRGGEPWFVLSDVCRILDIQNRDQTSARLDDDEKDTADADTPGGVQRVITINESGLYSVILRSDKPAAKRFKKWVTSEVLPSIRKTGAYAVAPSAREPVPLLALERRLASVEALLARFQRTGVISGKATIMEYAFQRGVAISTEDAQWLANRAKAIAHFRGPRASKVLAYDVSLLAEIFDDYVRGR